MSRAILAATRSEVYGDNGYSRAYTVAFVNRRAFLQSCLAAPVMVTPLATLLQRTFVGRRAGDAHVIGGIAFGWCPAGRFVMGSPASEKERRAGEDQVMVTLTRGFWTAKFETTQGDWQRILGALPGPLTKELPPGPDYPVGNVTFDEADEFCRTLTNRCRRTGELPDDWAFRIPTEAQWEYACRAGSTTATSFGDALSSTQANFKGAPYNGAKRGPSLNHATRVGSYPANAWGLCDMHGNAAEWCRDWYHDRLPGGVDPDLSLARNTAAVDRDGTRSRVRRGGCWADDGWALRSAFRVRFPPESRDDHIGFRIVAVEDAVSA
jgi:formylglycine-generating enzyme required for sulfatase activity